MPTHRWGDYTPSGHLGRILDDKTPQLGGMLDGNGFTFNGAVAFEAQAGEALSKGNVVYVSGVSGNKPVVMKADADDAAKMPAFGIAETDANLNANVNVVTFGTVYEIDTSAYSAGDELYVSTTAGALTATKPTGATARLQNIGKVIRSHASAGSIKVGGAGRTNAVPNLDNGTVFIGDSNNQAEQRALVEADISDFGTYLTAESDTLDSVTDRGATTTNAITVGNLTSTEAGTGSGGGGVISETASAGGNAGFRFRTGGTDRFNIVTIGSAGSEALRIYDYNNSQERMRINSSGNVGIGVTDPDNLLTVGGGTQPRILIRANGDAGASQLNFGDASDIDIGRLRYDHSDNSMSFFTSATERMSISSSGTVTISNGSGSGSNGNLTLTASSSGNEGGQINFNTVSSGTYSIDAFQDELRFLNGTTAGNYLWYKNSNSGIGMTLTGAGDLDVDGVITADEFNTPNHQATNLAVGWYTIAYLASGRAGARFAVWDQGSGRHQYCVLYASHMYGNNNSNTINILTYAVYSGSPIQKFRLKESGTYDGAALQVYIDDASNNVRASIVGDNVQSPGWTLADWVDDATNPGVNGTWSSFVGRAEIDLADVGQGGISATGNVLAGSNIELTTQYADLLFNGESGQGRITTGSGAAGGFTVDNVYSGAGINFKNSGAVEIYSSADSAAVGSLTIDTGGGINIGGSAIGSRVNSISIVGDTNSSPIAMKNSQHATVFSVLPWSSGISYLSSGTYYDDGAWVHASDNAYSALFHLAGTGANWYASSNSTASWNLASNQVLWNSAGQWSNDVSLASTKDIILPLNNNDIMFQAANVDITANSGRSGVVRFANTAADTWTGFSSYTGGRDWQYLHRDGDCGIYDNTAGQWKIRHNTGAGTYFYYGATLTTQTTSEGTYTDGIGTFATASGPAIKISDTSGTGALNHNSWLSFRDSGGTEVGYVGYGSGSTTTLSVSNYSNGIVSLSGTYVDGGSDFRAGIMYDTSDTAYYCNPAGTSRFNINYSNNHSTLAGNGYGLRFWNSDSYKIFMSTTAYGGQANGQNTSDYNIYFTMSSGTNRGFVFRNTTTGLKAAIDGNARGYFERVHIHDGQNANGGLTTGSTYLDVKYNATGGGGIRLFDSEGTINTYLYGAGNGEGGLLDNDGSWFCRSRTGTSPNIFYCNGNNELYVYTSYVRAIASFRAPIFYDMDNTTYYANFSSTADSIRAAGDIVAYYSDERLKNIEGPIENALDKVSTLNGFYYRGNEKAQKLGYDDKLKVGLSAQDVQKVLPEIIKSCPADNRYMTLDYSKVVPLLVEAIKELKSEIEELKK